MSTLCHSTHTATHTHKATYTHTLAHTRAYAVCVYPWHAKSAQLMNSSVLIITHTPHCAKDVEHRQPTPPPHSHCQQASALMVLTHSALASLSPPPTFTHFEAQIVPGAFSSSSSSFASPSLLSLSALSLSLLLQRCRRFCW